MSPTAFFIGLLIFFALMGVGILIGRELADENNKHHRRSLARREAKIRTQIDALARTQRLNAAYQVASMQLFQAAREAMGEEAMRQHRRSTPR